MRLNNGIVSNSLVFAFKTCYIRTEFRWTRYSHKGITNILNNREKEIIGVWVKYLEAT